MSHLVKFSLPNIIIITNFIICKLFETFKIISKTNKTKNWIAQLSLQLSEIFTILSE